MPFKRAHRITFLHSFLNVSALWYCCHFRPVQQLRENYMIISMRKRLAVGSASREQEKRGFTLTEIAIVLGIVGLILGAIWVAAAAVYSNLRTSKATTELLNIVQNVRALYATAGAVSPQADMAMSAAGTQGAGAARTY